MVFGTIMEGSSPSGCTKTFIVFLKILSFSIFLLMTKKITPKNEQLLEVMGLYNKNLNIF